MIKRIRKGNNISVNWIVHKNENSRNLSEDSLQLYLVDALKKKTEITDFTVSGNVISFIFYGKNQCHLNSGKFSLLLIANRCTDEQFVLDKQDVFILLDKLDGQVETGNGPDNISIETINIISEAVTGNVSVDLSRYYTKEEIDTMFASIAAQEAEDMAAMNEKTGRFNHTLGRGLVTQNQSETAIGQFNVSSKNSYTFGDSGNTLLSVGNGTSDNYRQNAIEVRQNGDVYIRLNGQVIKIQDIIQVEDDNGVKKIKFIGKATESDTTGLVSETDLANMDLAKKQWVTQQIIDYVTSGQVDMELYVSKNELASYNFAYHTEVEDLSEHVSSYYVTKDELNSFSYVTYDELLNQGYLDWDDVNIFVTMEYITQSQFATLPDIQVMGYITRGEVIDMIPDVSSYVKSAYITQNYYTKEQVNSLVLEQIQTNFVEKDLLFKSSAAYTITIGDIDRWNTPQEINLTSYATKDYVNQKIEQIPSPDFSPYVTNNQLSRMGYITEHQSLTDYATKSYVSDKIQAIPSVDLTPYATKEEISQAGYLTQHQDLSSYATKSYVDEKIQSIPSVDLTPYATKEEISSAGYITEHQDLSSYATKSYVDEKIAAIPNPDLSSYVTYTYLESRIDNIVTEETDPVFTASPANSITNENIAVINKLQYSNAFKKLEFNSESDSNDGFLATENYVLDQISQNSNIVIKLTRSQFDFLTEQGLVDEHKIYMIMDEDDEVVHNDDLDSYATKTYVGNELSYYYTKTEIQALIANIGSSGTIDLTGYATEVWVQEYISGLNLANKTYVQSQVASALQSAKDYADSIESNGIDLTNYATKSYLNNKLNNYATLSDIPDTSYMASRTWVNTNFATKGELQNIDYNNIDLSNYVSKQQLSQAGYLTQHQSLQGYATESYVTSKIQTIPSVDLTPYATKEEISQAGYLTQHQSLEGYATESYVTSKIQTIPAIDLTGYATESYVISKINDIQTPDLSDYATKTYVLDKIEAITGTDLTDYVSKQELSSCGYLTEHQDLSGYATKTYMNQVINQKIASLDIPEEQDLTPYATKSYVQNKIDAIEFPQTPDLSNYATKTYVTNKINSIDIPDMNNYATKTYVNAQIAAAGISGNIIWTGTQVEYDALQDKTQYQIYLISQ